jgi:ATP-dependent RNA helicase SUPV3L1/SUV3
MAEDTPSDVSTSAEEITAPAEPASEAAPEATAETASDATPETAAPIAAEPEGEPELVEMEIWRPQRRHKPSDRPRRHHRKAADAPANADATATPDGKTDDAAKTSRRERNKGKYDAFGKGKEAGQTGDGRKPGGHKGKRPDRNKGGERDRNAKGGGKGNAKGSAKGSERREWSSAPPRRERGIDPDSPFAALAVLKERVEGK